ncbi:MAG: TCR/Tet family MFS transporter, partial [Verrucomicrobiales bacterium]
MTSRRPALGFIFITLVLDILGIGIIVPVLPKLVEHFKGGSVEAAAHTLGFLSALYALMQFLFAPVLGSLSDKVGRRPVILFSLFGSGVDYFFLAFAPSLAWFFVGRMISGITGSSFSAATAYIADVSPPEKRAANFGLVGAAFGLGFILGPLIGGILGQYGLHVPFVVAGCLTLANWLYGLLVLPESLKPENRRAFSLARANPVGSLLDLKRFPAVLGLALTHFLICLAHQVLPSTWVLYTSYRYHWSELQTGVSLAFVGFMAAMVQGGLNRVAVKRLGEAKSASIGLLVATAAYALYGFATEGWMVYVIIFFGSAAGLTGPAIQG